MSTGHVTTSSGLANPEEALTLYSGTIETLDNSSELDALVDAVRETSEKFHRMGPVIKGYGEENGTFVNFGGYRLPNIVAPATLCTGEVYAVVSYDAHMKMYTNPAISSSLFKGTVEPFFGPTLSPKDAPEHPKYRAVMQRGFTPKKIEMYKDTVVRPVLARRFSALKKKGKADLVKEINIFYPYEAIGTIVGYDLADIEFVANCMHKIWQGNVDVNTAIEGGTDLQKYAAKLIEKRRKKPGEDYVSALLEAEIDGEKISDHDLVGLVNHFLSGGIETTYKQTSLLVFELLNNPDQLEILRNNRELIPNAIEEVLRYSGIGGITCRNTIEAVGICGVTIPKDAVVFTLHLAANRDPRRWENPNQFDVSRPIQKHMSFAAGGHMCIGQHMARLLLSEYLNHFLDDLPKVRWDPSAPAAKVTGWSQRAANSLPVIWDV